MECFKLSDLLCSQINKNNNKYKLGKKLKLVVAETEVVAG